MVANPGRGHPNRENYFFPGPVNFPWSSSRLGFWSRETGSAVPSCVRPLILHTRVESDWLVFLPLSATESIFLFIPSTVIGSVPIIVDRVKQLRTDDFHFRESTGTGTSVLKVVPVTGAAFSGFTMDQFLCASLSPHPLLVCSGRCDTFRTKGGLRHSGCGRSW